MPFAAVALTTTLVWSVLEMSDAILLGFLRGPDDVAQLRAITPLMRGHTLISAAFRVRPIRRRTVAASGSGRASR